jgi:AraC-like DNA-binding protein
MTSLSVIPSGRALLADYPVGSVFGPRTLHNCEFIWVVSGSARWTWQRSGAVGEVVLRPGMLALATTRMRDRLQWDTERRSRHGYLHFDVTTTGDADSDGDLPEPDRWPTVRNLSTTPVLRELCSYLEELATMADPGADARNTEVLDLLLKIFVAGPFRDPAALDEHLTAVVDHVRRGWTDGPRIVSIEELCDATGLSAGHLHRIFRQRYGCGPIRSLELIRLARAAVALQRSNQTLADVASRCGFANAYHFSRRFTGTYGIRPGRYRRQEDARDPYDPLRTAGLLPFAQALLQ